MSGAIWITVSDRSAPTAAYIDDVVIASSTLEEHLSILQRRIPNSFGGS